MSLNKKRIILIVGYGQDGKILHQYYLNKNNKVHILIKKKTKVIIKKNTFYKSINIENKKILFNYLKKFNNLDIYFLATHNISSTQKENKHLFKKNFNLNVSALINFLEFMSNYRKKNFKLFYASSSHIYENSKVLKQDENTLASFHSNYAQVKYLGLKICEYYRNHKNIFCSTGILYTHVSKHINERFLIKELANKIKKTKTNYIYVKNKDAKIDIMLASDAVLAMIKILSLKKPDNFIISSGRLTSIKEIFSSILLFFSIKKKIILKNKNKNKKVSNSLFGNNNKLFKLTNWRPKNNLNNLIKEVLS